MTTQTKAFYTVAEFADAIGMSAIYVSRKCHSGAIRAAKLGNVWRIPAQSLAEFMATDAPEPEALAAARPDLSAKQKRAVDQRIAAAYGITP